VQTTSNMSFVEQGDKELDHYSKSHIFIESLLADELQLDLNRLNESRNQIKNQQSLALLNNEDFTKFDNFPSLADRIEITGPIDKKDLTQISYNDPENE